MAKAKIATIKTAADYAAEWFDRYYADDSTGGYIPREVFVNYVRNQHNDLQWRVRKQVEKLEAAYKEVEDAHANIRQLLREMD